MGLVFGQCLVGRHGDSHAELCADAWFEVRFIRRIWNAHGLAAWVRQAQLEHLVRGRGRVGVGVGGRVREVGVGVGVGQPSRSSTSLAMSLAADSMYGLIA